MESFDRKKGFLSKEFLLSNAVYFVVIAFIITMSIVSDRFLAGKNIINLLTQSTVLMALSIGMALTMLTQGIDMSMGSLLFLCAAVMQYCGKKLDWGAAAMCAAGLGAGVLVGALNGVIAAKLQVYPLLTTLASMYACRGVGLCITGGGTGLMPMSWGRLTSHKLLGIPVQVYIVVLIAILFQIFLSCTAFGRHVYAVGDSEKTAREKGIRITAVKVFAYAASGFMAGVAGIISSSQVVSVPANLGSNQETMAIIAAVLGGTSLFGGRGTTFPCALIGALIMSCISNSLVLLGAPPNAYNVVYACVIFFVVLIDTIKSKILK